MRLLDFLTEAKSEYQDVIDIIEKECGYYLKLLRTNNIDIPLFRGVSDRGAKYHNLLYKKVTRQDRLPQGMDNVAFQNFNIWLEKHGHVPRYKSVSAHSDYYELGAFGMVHYFLPIGKFNYTYIKADDVNSDEYESDECSKIVRFFPTDPTEEETKVLNDNIITNKGIREAYDKEYEIWFDCKEYFLIPFFYTTSNGHLQLIKLNIKYPISIKLDKNI